MNNVKGKVAKTEGWKNRHVRAWLTPKGFEAPFVSLIEGLQDYRVEYEARYGSKIGDDYVLGTSYLKLAKTIIELLAGETGNLEAGEVEHLIRRTLDAAGFTEDEVNGLERD